MKKTFLGIATLAIMATIPILSIHAAPQVMAKAVICHTENASISVSFNSMESDLNVIKNKFDEKAHDIEQIAKQAGVEKFNLQSSNYNVSVQNYNSDAKYNFNGNLNFAVVPPSKALDVMAALVKKGYQASLNAGSYNSYNTPNVPCSNNAVSEELGE